MPSISSTQTVIQGLGFGEGPHWRDDRLFVSDIFRRKVLAAPIDGVLEEIVTVPGRPTGLGTLRDGSLVIASATDRRLLRWDGDAVSEYADLSEHGSGHLNDLYVDSSGRVYVGSLGFELWNGKAPSGDVPPGTLHMVDEDGAVHDLASELTFPNGITVLDSTSTLVIAESSAHKLTAYDVAPDGTLDGRRDFAVFGDKVSPDGITRSPDGETIWFASATSSELLCVSVDGEVRDRIGREATTIAVAFGGPDGSTLFSVESGMAPGDVHAAVETAAGSGAEIAPGYQGGSVTAIEFG